MGRIEKAVIMRADQEETDRPDEVDGVKANNPQSYSPKLIFHFAGVSHDGADIEADGNQRGTAGTDVHRKAARRDAVTANMDTATEKIKEERGCPGGSGCIYSEQAAGYQLDISQCRQQYTTCKDNTGAYHHPVVPVKRPYINLL